MSFKNNSFSIIHEGHHIRNGIAVIIFLFLCVNQMCGLFSELFLKYSTGNIFLDSKSQPDKVCHVLPFKDCSVRRQLTYKDKGMRHIYLAISVNRTLNRRLLHDVEFSKRMHLYRNVLAEKLDSTRENEKEVMKKKDHHKSQ